MSPFTLYGKLKWVGVILPNSFRRKPIRWICTSPLDVWDSTSPGAFNSALRNSKRRWQVWGVWNIPSHMCELKNRVVLCRGSQNPVFSLSTRRKNQSFEGLLWGQRPELVYWALGPIWWCGYVRGEVNDWKGLRMEDHVREEWRDKVRGGYPSRIGRISVRQVPRRLRWPSRNFQR